MWFFRKKVKTITMSDLLKGRNVCGNLLGKIEILEDYRKTYCPYVGHGRYHNGYLYKLIQKEIDCLRDTKVLIETNL